LPVLGETTIGAGTVAGWIAGGVTGLFCAKANWTNLDSDKTVTVPIDNRCANVVITRVSGSDFDSNARCDSMAMQRTCRNKLVNRGQIVVLLSDVDLAIRTLGGFAQKVILWEASPMPM
jgi:hypothetical protein